MPGRAPLLTGLGLCLLAARATGKVILDGVYNDIKDDDGFAAECRQGRRDGLRRQDADPPEPGRAVQRGVRPEPRPRSTAARRIIAAFEEAVRRGEGVVTVDGRMIENLHVDDARRVLALADAIEGIG